MRFDALVSGPRDGELVLLLHGFPQTATCWRQALVALGNAGYRAVAPNQRGYSPGAMPAGVAAYSLDELVADAVAMAHALGRQRFHLVGHDWGGSVAWSVAAQHAASLDTLTVLSTPHSAALREALKGTRQRLQMSYIAVIRFPGVAERLFDAAGGVILEHALVATGLSRAHARRDIANLRRLGPTGALNWYRANLPVQALLGRTGGPQLPMIKATTLGIWSTGDLYLTEDAMTRSEQRVQGRWRYERFEGSHWVPLDEPDRLNRLLLEFLA